MKKYNKKRKRKLLFKSLLCFVIIGFCIFSSLDNIKKIQNKTKEKEKLTEKLEELKEEEKILTDDVEKLKDPEYAARYAREKYLYSKNGEKIIKID